MIKKLTAKTENDMRLLGERLAELVRGGEFIALFGGLGAGKTTLVRYFASSLGADAAASPTFTIVRSYTEGRVPILHFDCYRLADADELFAIGFDDYLASNSVILMEWSKNVLDALPDERLEIRLEGSGSDPREVTLSSYGVTYDELLGGLEL